MFAFIESLHADSLIGYFVNADEKGFTALTEENEIISQSYCKYVKRI